jgi:hypothetical protein
MDMFGMGLIDQNLALRLLEVGGAQKILDLVQVAERKAQRENIKMKMLNPAQLQEAQMQMQMQVQQAEAMGQMIDVQALQSQPFIPVDDFDVHEKHIEIHNIFRMSQEYEVLAQEVRDEFDKHVAQHEMYLQQAQMQMQMAQMQQEGQIEGPGATMSGNGQVPDMTPTPGA